MSEYRKVDDNKGGRRPPPRSNNNNGDGSSNRRQAPPTRGAGERQAAQAYQQVDITDLRVEEDIQNEKLKAAREIKEGLQDVKDVYDEFGRLVEHQQAGLNEMEKNVGSATVNMQKGQEQLQGAKKEQTRSRKCMCILIGLLVAIVAVIIIVVVVVMKK